MNLAVAILAKRIDIYVVKCDWVFWNLADTCVQKFFMPCCVRAPLKPEKFLVSMIIKFASHRCFTCATWTLEFTAHCTCDNNLMLSLLTLSHTN